MGEMLIMKPLSEIHNIVTNRHEVAKKWKEKTGGKVLGYLNIDIPEELVYAAGILPVRILGSHEPETITDPYLWNMLHRVFERDCLAQGLQGRYDYLDGLLSVRGNPHEEACYMNWTRVKNYGYRYLIRTPTFYGSRHAPPFLLQEMKDFKKSLEEWVGKDYVKTLYELLAYSILRYRLMDITVAITRTGIFIAVYTLVLGVPFAAALWLKNWLIGLFWI